MSMKQVATDEDLALGKNHNDLSFHRCISNCKRIALYVGTLIIAISVITMVGYTLFLIHEYYMYLKEDRARVVDLLGKIFTHSFVSLPFIILWLKK